MPVQLMEVPSEHLQTWVAVAEAPVRLASRTAAACIPLRSELLLLDRRP